MISASSVSVKMRVDLLLQCRDLVIESAQHCDSGPGGGRIRGSDHRRPTEVLTAQRGLDPSCLVLDVTTASIAQRRGDLTAC